MVKLQAKSIAAALHLRELDEESSRVLSRVLDPQFPEVLVERVLCELVWQQPTRPKAGTNETADSADSTTAAFGIAIRSSLKRPPDAAKTSSDAVNKLATLLDPKQPWTIGLATKMYHMVQVL